MPLIVDLHNGRPEPSWSDLKKRGVTGVYLKATEGATFRDKLSAGRAKRARAVGMRVGFYHFARPSGGDSLQEAVNFVRWVKDAGGIKRRDLKPMLDLETLDGISKSSLGSWCRNWNRSVKADLGVGPGFYSYSDFIWRMNLTVPIGYGLWLANYGAYDDGNPPKPFERPLAPKPWKQYVLHQYTSKGAIGGSYRGDISYYEPGKIRGLLAHPVLGLV